MTSLRSSTKHLRNANNYIQILPEDWRESDASPPILKTSITVILKPDKIKKKLEANIPHEHRIIIKLQKSYSVVLASR